ncbi:MAG: CHAT domain-containing protein [Acidimicrobiales bacterium]
MIDEVAARRLANRSSGATDHWRSLGAPIDELVEAAEVWVDREPAVAERLVDLGRSLTDGDRLLDARLAHVGARVAAGNGRVEEADRLLGEAFLGFEQSGAQEAAARSRLGQAHVRAMAGDLATAERLLNDLLRICDELPDRKAAEELEARATLDLGIVDDLHGRHEEAAGRFTTAGRLAAAAGDDRVRLQALNNRAHSLTAAGRTGEALAVARRLLGEADATGEPVLHAEGQETIGRALMLAGDLGGAIDSLGRAEEMFGQIGAEDRLLEVRSTLADVHLAADLPEEAERLLDDILSCLDPGQRLHLARALLGRGRARSRIAASGAREDLDSAADIYSDMEDRSGEIAALSALAELEWSRDRPDSALAHLDEARRLADPISDPCGALLVELTTAEVATDPAPALSRAAGLLAVCDLPPMRAVLTARQGRLALSEDRVGDAVRHLTSAIDIFEQVRGSLLDGRYRRTYMMARLDVFADLVTAQLREGGEAGVRAALHTVERGRARALLDLVEGSIVSTAEGFADADTERLQELLADVGSLYDRLLGPEGGRGAGALLAQAAELESEIDQLAQRTPVMELGTAGAPVAGPEIAHTIRHLDVSLVSYHWLDDRLEAFVLVADDAAIDGMSVRRVDLGADRRKIGDIRRRIESNWSRLRPALGLEARWSDPLLRSGLAAVAEARAAVWDPLWADARPPRRAVIVPASGIDALPFPALAHDDVDPVELVVSPSISVWVRREMQADAGGDAGPSLVVGSGGPGLDHVEPEARAVAAVIGSSADLHIGDAATSEAVAGCDRPAVLHLAAHGLFRRSNPMFSVLRLAGEWITAIDLMSIDLTGSLVVLSACETGRADLLPDSEAFGFVRAALAAGARTFVGSHWLVNDHSTSELMRRFHERLAEGSPPAVALAKAQREVRQVRPHPYHWSSFTVSGAGFSPVGAPRRSDLGGDSP